MKWAPRPPIEEKNLWSLVQIDKLKEAQKGHDPHQSRHPRRHGLCPNRPWLGNMTEIVGRCRFYGGSIHRYFREWRSVDQTMIYEQRRTVVCADYRVGRFYIAPVDLENWGGR